MIDNLSYARALEDAGVPREQAEAQALVLTDIVRRKQAQDRSESILQSASKADFATCRDQIVELTFQVEALKAQVAQLLSSQK